MRRKLGDQCIGNALRYDSETDGDTGYQVTNEGVFVVLWHPLQDWQLAIKLLLGERLLSEVVGIVGAHGGALAPLTVAFAHRGVIVRWKSNDMGARNDFISLALLTVRLVMMF